MKSASPLKNRSALFEPVFYGALFLTLGVLTWRQSGMYRDMETLWRTTIARNPGSAMAHNNLGLLLFQRGGVNEAMYYLKRAVALDPTNAEAHNNLGNALREKRRLEEAIVHFRKASEIRSDFAIYHANLGSVLAEMGRTPEAIVHYQTALEKAPADAFMMSNLAWLLATSPDASVRNGARAVELAERAVHLSDGSNPTIAGTLAAAYAEAGRFDEAIAAGENARALALARRNSRLAELNAGLLELYRAGRPYHGN